MNRPKLVGITGGIGSGKTTVCKIFETLGVSVYYADDRAKFIMENDENVIAQITELFGGEAYRSGKLNRQQIAARAFTDKSLLEQLNQIVHPAVKLDFERWVDSNNAASVLMKEAALLIETGSYKELDALVVVIADENVRINRVVQRDSHRKVEDIQKIISEQLNDDRRIPVADFVISNNDHESLIRQVTDIFSRL